MKRPAGPLGCRVIPARSAGRRFRVSPLLPLRAATIPGAAARLPVAQRIVHPPPKRAIQVGVLTGGPPFAKAPGNALFLGGFQSALQERRAYTVQTYGRRTCVRAARTPFPPDSRRKQTWVPNSRLPACWHW